MQKPFEHSDYVELSMHFRCNLKCKHCMILDSMHWLNPADDAEFSATLEKQKRTGQWKGIILTGAEVTLRKELPDWAKQARRAGFEHVRIQTHAMRLADPAYCETLVAAGIDEYFISVTAATAELHDQITEVPGSFEKTITALRNLDKFSQVKLMTNTVITRLSYQSAPDLVELLKDLQRLVQMDFWGYWPMEEDGHSDLLAPHTDVRPYLKTAIQKAREYRRHVEIKNFPACLLGEDARYMSNDQPELRTDPNFWTEFNRNGFHQCAYRDVCGSKQCLGLNSAYIKLYGWMEDVLSPLPRQELRP